MATTEYSDIFHSEDHGKLRIGASGISWRALDSSRTVNVLGSDIKWVEWVRVARNFRMRLGLEGWKREAFDGFTRNDYDTLAESLKSHFSLTLNAEELSWRGWNWGTTDFRGQDIVFLVGNKPAFEIPLTKIANSNIAGKTEVSIEFTPPEEQEKQSRKGAMDELTELRLYIPGTHQKNEDGEEIAEEDQSAAQVFHDTIKEKADIGQVTGDGIIIFNEVLVQTPRGRYDIGMYPTFLRLHGKAYDYKVPYSTITRLFLLPKANEHITFVVGLDPPIRQGQTRYPFLVMLFNRDEEMTAELNMEEETINTQYEGKLEKHYDASTYEVVSQVFRGLSGKKILAPASSFAQDSDPGHHVKCNLKAVQGELYFLEKSLLFLSRQPSLIAYNEIYSAVFSRVGGAMASARTFDLRIEQKTGPEITFSSINKEEKDHIEQFLTYKKVKVQNELNDDAMAIDLGSDDDDEMQSVASSGEAAPRPRGGDNDEETSEDEDFHASSSDEGSPTSSSGSESGSGSESSPKKVAPKKKKVKSTSGSPEVKKKAKKFMKDDSDAEGVARKHKVKKSKPKVKPDDDSEGDGPAKKKKRVD